MKNITDTVLFISSSLVIDGKYCLNTTVISWDLSFCSFQKLNIKRLEKDMR